MVPPLTLSDPTESEVPLWMPPPTPLPPAPPPLAVLPAMVLPVIVRVSASMSIAPPGATAAAGAALGRVQREGATLDRQRPGDADPLAVERDRAAGCVTPRGAADGLVAGEQAAGDRALHQSHEVHRAAVGGEWGHWPCCRRNELPVTERDE